MADGVIMPIIMTAHMANTTLILRIRIVRYAYMSRSASVTSKPDMAGSFVLSRALPFLYNGFLIFSCAWAGMAWLRRRNHPMCGENLDSNVLMVHPADRGVRHDAPDPLNRASDRHISWRSARAAGQGSIMFQKPTVADLRQAAHKLGMNPSDAYLNAVEQIITPLANAYAALDTTPDELPAVK